MKRTPILMLALGLIAAPSFAEKKRIGTPPEGAPAKEIEVGAKKYEFTPSTIEVPVGTLLEINLQSADREHGFAIKGVKNSCVKFKPGQPATLEFYADKAGEYEFECCKFCGMGHHGMKGKLVVK